MTPETVLTLSRHAMEMLLLTAGPLLLLILVVGLIISLFQAVTQINEQTLSFVPKVVLATVFLVLAGPWMLQNMVDYLQQTLLAIPDLVSGRLGG